MNRVFRLCVSYRNGPQQRRPRSSNQVFLYFISDPRTPLFWGGGFLGGYIPLHGAMQGWLGETVKGRGSESEGAALEGFCLDWSVWAESCLLSCLAELLHGFAGSLLNGDENHPCL